MEWNKKYSYPSSTRAIVNGSRHYSMDGFNLPSVTTILAATKSEEDKAAIAAKSAGATELTAEAKRRAKPQSYNQ